MKHNLFSRFIGVLLAVVMLASLMSMPSLANTVSGEDLAVTDVQTTDTVDGTGEETTDEAGSDPAALSVEGEEDKTTAGEENGEPDAEEGAASENEAASSSEEGTVPEENTASSDVDTSSAEETAPAAVQLTAEAKNEAGAVVANVTVEADEGVIPEGAALVADLLTGNDAEAAGNDLDEAGVEYDGYMALDIHLEDADGNEVEPNGEVRLIMVAPAALPEDADPTTVAVQHHEEQDNGEVKVEEVASAANTDATPATLSADTASSEQPATGVAAENTDVTAAFGVEKFSTFTITWENSGSELTIYLYNYNQNGRFYQSIDTAPVSDKVINQAAQLEAIAEEVAPEGYTFRKAVVAANSNNLGKATEIKRLRYNNNRWQCNTNITGSNGWTNLGSQRVYFIYTVVGSNELPRDIPTNSTADTIDIDLVDFSQYDTGAGRYSSINDGKNLNFAAGLGEKPDNPNQWSGSNNRLVQNIVKPLLGDDGYPITTKGNWGWDTEQSLNYLFNPDLAKENGNYKPGIVKAVWDADYLFQYNEQTRSYTYDSDSNGARVADNGRFTVYADKEETAGFNPFGENWGSLNEFFSMRISTSFIMPENGLVNGQPMVFSFSGDDDVWVFVDDVLVLDIGGIHGEAEGEIDFNSGNVRVETSKDNYTTKKLAKIFTDQGKTWDSSKYETHTLTFFYLERGGSESNCKITFNMPIVPPGTLRISKDLTEKNSETQAVSSELEDYLKDTMEYKFRVLAVGESGKPNPEEDSLFVGEGKVYQIWEGDEDTGKRVTTEGDGIITLKAGQMAVIPEVIDDKCGDFYVQELVPENATGQYGEIKYTVGDQNGSVNEENADRVTVDSVPFKGYNSSVIEPPQGTDYKNESYAVQYENVVDTSKMAMLKITKSVPGASSNNSDVFSMEVKVNGEKLPAGTTYTVEPKNKDSNGEEKAEEEVAKGEEGIVKLKAGQTATILMLADASYTVKENEISGKNYQFVSYTRKSEIPEDETPEGEESEAETLKVGKSEDEQISTAEQQSAGIGNTIQYPGQVDTVTVTNKMVTTTLTLKKVFDGLTGSDVAYLLFDQKGGTKLNDQFAFDVNYAWTTKISDKTETHEIGSDFNPAEWDRIKALVTKPNGDELGKENGSSGGDFKVIPKELMKEQDARKALADGNRYTSDRGAVLEKDSNGNWVYTQEITVPTCGEDCYFTVFEMHAEMPGYAKQGAASSDWIVQDADGDTIVSGKGKVVGKTNVSEDIDDSSVNEDDLFENDEFYHINIQGPVTVTFTNRYTGEMQLTKTVEGLTVPTDKTFTVTIEPAYPKTLEDLVDDQNFGPAFEGKTFTVSASGETDSTVTFTKGEDNRVSATVTIKPGKTYTLTGLPTIQYKVTEDQSTASIEGYDLEVKYNEQHLNIDESRDVDNEGNVNYHWNKYNSEYGKDTDKPMGWDNNSDGIVAVDVNQDPTNKPVTSVTITNEYTPAVGYLTINKVLQDKDGISFAGLENGKDVFTFQIKAVGDENKDKGKVWYAFVDGNGYATLTGGTNDVETAKMQFAAGEYEITELSNINYTCSEAMAVVDGGEPETSATATIIVKVGGNAVTAVTYTNTVQDKGLTDGSGVINQFSGKGETITFGKITIAGDQVEKGEWDDKGPLVGSKINGERRNAQ